VARIAVVNVPFYSHIEAATRLASVLVGQGHEVVELGPEACREGVESAGASFLENSPEMPVGGDFTSFAAGMAETTERAVPGTIEQIHEQGVELVIHDSQAPWARVAAEYLGLPRIVTHPMFPMSTPHRVISAVEQIEFDGDPDESRERFETAWRSIAGRWGVELGELSDVIHTASMSEVTVGFTTQTIVGDYGPAGWDFIGPLMPPPAPRQPTPGGRPLVYVCFGTSFNTRVHTFRAVIEGLADEPVDVLVSTGMGPVSRAELGPLPANVDVQEFVEARDVLSRASIHITHSGCNSVHESLLSGVPMLCMPQAYDQFPLAWRVEVLGAGRIVQETAGSIREGARWLLDDRSATLRTAELSRHLRNYDGERRVAQMLDRVLSAEAAAA
jgi:MGT family glycosyltransferase